MAEIIVAFVCWVVLGLAVDFLAGKVWRWVSSDYDQRWIAFMQRCHDEPGYAEHFIRRSKKWWPVQCFLWPITSLCLPWVLQRQIADADK